MSRLTLIRAGWHIAWASLKLESQVALLVYVQELYAAIAKSTAEKIKDA